MKQEELIVSKKTPYTQTDDEDFSIESFGYGFSEENLTVVKGSRGGGGCCCCCCCCCCGGATELLED